MGHGNSDADDDWGIMGSVDMAAAEGPRDVGFTVTVHAPDADVVEVQVDSIDSTTALRRRGTAVWVGEVPIGSRYVLFVDGRPVLDPHATEVWFPAGHTRLANRPGRTLDPETFPRAVARAWPPPQTTAHDATTRRVRGARARNDEASRPSRCGDLPGVGR